MEAILEVEMNALESATTKAEVTRSSTVAVPTRQLRQLIEGYSDGSDADADEHDEDVRDEGRDEIRDDVRDALEGVLGRLADLRKSATNEDASVIDEITTSVTEALRA